MKITFYISAHDYNKFLDGKEVDLKSGDGWAGYIKVTVKHSEIRFKGEKTAQYIKPI